KHDDSMMHLREGACRILWSRQSRQQGPAFMTADAAREFATEIVRRLRGAGHVAYFAGGCVRDLLLGRGAKDFDVATTATPEQVRDLFGRRKTLAVGQSFGVVIVIAPNPLHNVEVATFRTEGDYRDGRR